MGTFILSKAKKARALPLPVISAGHLAGSSGRVAAAGVRSNAFTLPRGISRVHGFGKLPAVSQVCAGQSSLRRSVRGAAAADVVHRPRGEAALVRGEPGDEFSDLGRTANPAHRDQAGDVREHLG